MIKFFSKIDIKGNFLIWYRLLLNSKGLFSYDMLFRYDDLFLFNIVIGVLGSLFDIVKVKESIRDYNWRSIIVIFR